MNKTIKYILVLAAAITALMAEGCSGKKTSTPEGDDPWSWRKEEQQNDPQPFVTKTYYPKATGSFRLMTYNVGAFAKYMTDSTPIIADMIKEVEADLVGLNEVDSCNTRHNVNQAAVLAKSVGDWQWSYGGAMAYRNGAYGNAVIVPSGSKIVSSYTVTLAKGAGSEQRSISVIETEDFVYGSCHLDHTSAEAQLAQVQIVNAWAQSKYLDCGKPVFFGGDMNATPESQTISALCGSWDLLSETALSYPSTGPSKCIDYIFHYKKSAPVKVIGSKVMTQFYNGNPSQTSDHLPVYVDVQF